LVAICVRRQCQFSRSQYYHRVMVGRVAARPDAGLRATAGETGRRGAMV